MTCDSTSATFVETDALARTSGTNEIAVNASVVRTKVRFACVARCENPTASSVPIIVATKVICAKPGSGIASPAILNETPVPSAAAAKTVVATDAYAPTTAPVRHSLRATRGAGVAGRVVGLSRVVAVIGDSLRVRRSGAGLTSGYEQRKPQRTPVRRFLSGTAPAKLGGCGMLPGLRRSGSPYATPTSPVRSTASANTSRSSTA